MYDWFVEPVSFTVGLNYVSPNFKDVFGNTIRCRATSETARFSYCFGAKCWAEMSAVLTPKTDSGRVLSAIAKIDFRWCDVNMVYELLVNRTSCW